MDLIDFFAEIFKLDYSIVNEYASQGPLYQLFYLVFFPTIFIIFFIYITSRFVIYSHKGLRILISAAIYAFIVLQGYYKWFVFLSKFWLFGIILLGLLYMILRRGQEPSPAGSGGGGGHGKSLGSGAFEKISNRLTMKITGQEKQMYDRIEADLRKLEGMKGGGHEYGDIYIHVEEELKKLEGLVRNTDVTGMGFAVDAKKYRHLMNRFLKLPNPSYGK